VSPKSVAAVPQTISPPAVACVVLARDGERVTVQRAVYATRPAAARAATAGSRPVGNGASADDVARVLAVRAAQILGAAAMAAIMTPAL
jgi:hypothetical protein